MKRWAVLVAALYLLVLAALTVPVLLTLGAELSSESPLREAFKAYAQPPYWIWVVVMAGCQLALLSVPVRVESRRPVTRGALWPMVLVVGLMMGILVTAAFLAIDEFVARESAGDDWISWSGLAAGIVTWGIWAFVFGRAARTVAPRDLVTRQCRLLFQGSVLELLIAVPTHIVARYRGNAVRIRTGALFPVCRTLAAAAPTARRHF
jgi:hypothetical protein